MTDLNISWPVFINHSRDPRFSFLRANYLQKGEFTVANPATFVESNGITHLGGRTGKYCTIPTLVFDDNSLLEIRPIRRFKYSFLELGYITCERSSVLLNGEPLGYFEFRNDSYFFAFLGLFTEMWAFIGSAQGYVAYSHELSFESKDLGLKLSWLESGNLFVCDRIAPSSFPDIMLLAVCLLTLVDAYSD